MKTIYVLLALALIPLSSTGVLASRSSNAEGHPIVTKNSSDRNKRNKPCAFQNSSMGRHRRNPIVPRNIGGLISQTVWIGPDDSSQLSALLLKLNTGNSAQRADAIMHMGLIDPIDFVDPYVPLLLRCLRDSSPRVREEAAYTLGVLKANEQSPDSLFNALRDDDERVREFAAKSLRQHLLSSSNSQFSPQGPITAVYPWETEGAGNRDGTQAIFMSSNWSTTDSANRPLINDEAIRAKWLPRIQKELLSSRDKNVQGALCNSLVDLSHDQESVNLLVKVLATERDISILNLGRLGSHSSNALPILATLLRKNEVVSPENTLRAILTIGSVPACSALDIVSVLEPNYHGDESTRLYAVEVLSRMQVLPREVIPLLVQAAESESSTLVRDKILNLLQKLRAKPNNLREN